MGGKAETSISLVSRAKAEEGVETYRQRRYPGNTGQHRSWDRSSAVDRCFLTIRRCCMFGDALARPVQREEPVAGKRHGAYKSEMGIKGVANSAAFRTSSGGPCQFKLACFGRK